MNEGVKVVSEKLVALGYSNNVIELPASARTAKEAADSINCDLAQIAKSIIFKIESSGKALLVVASGVNRIDEAKVEKAVGEKLGKAGASFVKEQTGFVIGGVAPIGHANKLQTIIDEDLFNYETVWAAAGHPKAVFELTASELVELTKGEVITVK